MPIPSIFEDLKHLQSVLLNRYAEAFNYARSWGKDYVFTHIQKLPESYATYKFDPNDLSLDDMLKLGFRTWDDSGLQLIPLWLFPYIKPGASLVSINGETFRFSATEDDNDHRFGLLAFGVIVDNKKPEPAEPIDSSDPSYDRAAESLGQADAPA